MEDVFEKFNKVNSLVTPNHVFDFIGAELAKEDGLKLTYACPYHTDDSPSLLVDIQAETFNCFACECGGRGAYSCAKYYLQFQNNAKPTVMMVINFLEEINPMVSQFRYLFEVQVQSEYDVTIDKRMDFRNRLKLPNYQTLINTKKKYFTADQRKLYIDAVMNGMPPEFIVKALKLESKEELERGSDEFLALLGED